MLIAGIQYVKNLSEIIQINFATIKQKLTFAPPIYALLKHKLKSFTERPAVVQKSRQII